jgi:hypothetical protein
MGVCIFHPERRTQCGGGIFSSHECTLRRFLAFARNDNHLIRVSENMLLNPPPPFVPEAVLLYGRERRISSDAVVSS